MDKEQERKTWYVGDVVWGTATMVYEGNDDPHKGRFVCDCDPFMFDDEVKLAGDGNTQHLAQQIADDHNRILEAEERVVHFRDVIVLERERAERAEAALAALEEAAQKTVTVLMRDTLATAENGLLNLYEALEQASAVLPTKQAEQQ